MAVLGRDALARPPVHSPPPSKWARNIWHRLFASRDRANRERVEYAKQLVRLAADRYAIPLPRVAIRFCQLTEHAGRIQVRDGVWYVDLSERHKWHDDRLTSIVAHEVAHIVLLSKGVRLEPTARNEELTDAVAALAGYVPLMRSANEQQHTENYILVSRTITTRLGYLRSRDLGRLARLRRYFRSDGPVIRWSPVDPHVDKSVQCPACGTRMRVPLEHARVDLQCPRCQVRQRLTLTPRPDSSHAIRAEVAMALNGLLRAVDRYRGLPL